MTAIAPAFLSDELPVLSLGARAERVDSHTSDAAAAGISELLSWCVDVGHRVPFAGDGHTRERWEVLAGTAARDVTVARVLEPHLDARNILYEADMLDRVRGVDDELKAHAVTDQSTWGVFAAEGSGMRVAATKHRRGWSLSGTKPWCSLAANLSHALVTAWVDGEHRRLFAVDLRTSNVRAHAGPWHARGLADVVSAPVEFVEAPAVPVGATEWYLTRPGFSWGAMAVAACWWGGAHTLAGALETAARSERADQAALVHLGMADAALWAARAVLAESADAVDAAARGLTPDSAPEAALRSARVRHVVSGAATLTLAQCDAALGPEPLVADASHARRVADLHLYLRQQHGVRDAARVGKKRLGLVVPA